MSLLAGFSGQPKKKPETTDSGGVRPTYDHQISMGTQTPDRPASPRSRGGSMGAGGSSMGGMMGGGMASSMPPGGGARPAPSPVEAAPPPPPRYGSGPGMPYQRPQRPRRFRPEPDEITRMRQPVGNTMGVGGSRYYGQPGMTGGPEAMGLGGEGMRGLRAPDIDPRRLALIRQMMMQGADQGYYAG